MDVETNSLHKRADALIELARVQGYNAVEYQLKLLPDDDVVARIGYLAALLKIDFGIAFDPDAPLDLGEEGA